MGEKPMLLIDPVKYLSVNRFLLLKLKTKGKKMILSIIGGQISFLLENNN